MKYFVSTLLIAVSLSAQSQTPKDSIPGLDPRYADDPEYVKAVRYRNNLDGKYGFRDLKFETAASNIKGLVALGLASHNSRTYQRPTDSKKVGKYTISSIRYTFYKNRLSGIRIDTHGYTNSRGVLDAFRALYGLGTQDNEYIEEYRWSGNKVLMNYEQNSITDNAVIYIWSIPMMDSENLDKGNNAKKATSDL